MSIHEVDVTRPGGRRRGHRATSRAALGTPTILDQQRRPRLASPADAALETGRFERYPESAWDAMIESHLKSALVVSQSFIAQFQAARRDPRSAAASSTSRPPTASSRPISRSTTIARKGGAEYYKPVGYSVAKSGVLNFTRWLAEYCAPFGVRVNTLVPGGVREDGHAPEFVAEYEKRTPLGRMAADDDYNGAVLFLASPRVGLHDRRHAGRRRRLDRKMNGHRASSVPSPEP